MAKNLLLDTGFWYALYDRDDQHHEDAQVLAGYLDNHNLVLPWPCLYETLNTRFIGRRKWLDSFSAYTGRISTILLSDEAYRNEALRMAFESPKPWLNLSLVDHVIRLALEDPNTRIDTIITFNPRDFCDVCYPRNIGLISG